MKHWYCILIFLSAISCRTIERSYYESAGPGQGETFYAFHKDGTFEYQSHDDAGAECGHGTYFLWGRRLTLKFTTKVDTVIPEKVIAHMRDSTSGSLSTVVYVKDETNSGAPGAVVMFQSPPGSWGYSAFTDLDGKARFMIHGNEDSVMITIRCSGYRKIEQKISVQRIDTITFQLQVSTNMCQSPVAPGTVWKYRIRHVRDETVLRKRE